MDDEVRHRARTKTRVLPVLMLFMMSSGLAGERQELGLAVLNGQLDLDSSSYSLELVNTSSKTIAGWTLTLEHQHGSDIPLRQLYEPDSCSLDTTPLPPAGVLRCRVRVNRWDTAPETPEIARVTSVLFADGTAAGDLEALDATIEKHWLTFREVEYWRKRLESLRSRPDLESALRSLEREARDEAPVLPDHDGYSHASVFVRMELISGIRNGLKQINDRRFPAQQVLDALVKGFQLHEKVDGLRANMFPRPKQRLWPAAVFRPSPRELRNTVGLTVLRFEENDHAIRIVIRNDTSRLLSKWGVVASDERGKISRASTGAGGSWIEPGWIEVLEAPAAPASYGVISLEATFGRAAAGNTTESPKFY